MLRLASFALVMSACAATTGGQTAGDPDLPLATQDTADADADAWDLAPTLHAGEGVSGATAAHGRVVYPIWIAGTAAAPVSLDVVALAHDGFDARVAVLGPLAGGARPVLGAGGYAQPKSDVEMSVDVTTTGEHLIVVGAFDLERDTAFDLATYCTDCAAGATDVLATPKAGALVGPTVHADVGDAARGAAATLELWAAPPLHTAPARRIAQGGAFDLVVPAGVAPGDDLTLVVRDARGELLDSGVPARFAPDRAALVRTDALVYAEGNRAVTASGVVGLFEGRAALQLRSEPAGALLAQAAATADRPGQVGNGLAAFDATLAPETVPAAGALMSVGTLDGNGDYVRLGCFAWTVGPRACP